MAVEFEQLIQRNHGRIRRIAMRYAVRSEIDDLIQEICLALWRSYGSFRGEAKEETWVYRVALNTAISGLRVNTRESERMAKLHATISTQTESPGGLSHADILTNFLNVLSEVDASILMMYLDGLTVAEMELVLGMNAGTINVRINRIKNKFSDTYVD